MGAFTIRFTGLKFDWNYRDYGQLFRKTQGGSDDLMIGFTGDAYVAAKRNKLIARLTPGKDVFGSEALPDWQHPDTKGLTWSRFQRHQRTDHVLRRRVGSRRVRASGRRTLLPAEFHVRTLLPKPGPDKHE